MIDKTVYIIIGLYSAEKEKFAKSITKNIVYSAEELKQNRKFNPDFPEELTIEEKKHELKVITEFLLKNESFAILTPVLNPMRLCRTISLCIDLGFKIKMYYIETTLEKEIEENNKRKFPIEKDIIIEEYNSMNFVIEILEKQTNIKVLRIEKDKRKTED